jgi:hypothetical protein
MEEIRNMESEYSKLLKGTKLKILRNIQKSTEYSEYDVKVGDIGQSC